MLIPGEFLTIPAADPPRPELPPARNADPLPVNSPVGETDEEPRSFLLILLRALGAMHT